MKLKKKIVITGGHVTPALAVIDILQKKYPEIEIVFIGRKYVNEREKSESFEYKEIASRKIRFIHLVTGRFTRAFTVGALQNILTIPYGFSRAYTIIKKEKPDAILSFGGYLALPVAYCAKLQKIPVFTHEQTVVPGLANTMIARIAQKVFISFPESTRHFKSEKVIYTGNPLRESIFKDSAPFDLPSGLPAIYITGGSLGAHAINALIEQILPQILEKAVVIHQTGNVQEYDDYHRLSQFKGMLKADLRKRYILKEHVADDEIGSIYKAVDLVIGRSGANTFFELIALGKPALFIPLPWAAGNEQREHAAIFKNQGAGEVFEQDGNSEELRLLIEKMLIHLSQYANKTKELIHYFKKDAAVEIIRHILAE
jgi:UDP-N-acetylglucosamine--N-acetylmuramyl-(pentapeptide) pyrophosphoryl-undecaprenol N-acetylglucosamine transferase